jgi:hypothetical protein
MSSTLANPIAPIINNGISSEMSGYQDQAFSYVSPALALTGNQYLPDQIIPIYTYADFAWRALIITVQTGLFSIRFSDGQGYYISNVLIDSFNLVGTPSDPFIIFPELLIPAGGRIQFDIQEGSGSPNNIQFVCVGVNRYRTKG